MITDYRSIAAEKYRAGRAVIGHAAIWPDRRHLQAFGHRTRPDHLTAADLFRREIGDRPKSGKKYRVRQLMGRC